MECTNRMSDVFCTLSAQFSAAHALVRSLKVMKENRRSVIKQNDRTLFSYSLMINMYAMDK